MKIVIAPDSFKGSLSAQEAAAAIARGVRRGLPGAQTVEVPIADGGEGTLDSLLASAGGVSVPVTVTGPLGEPVSAAYGLIGPERTAVIEMAEASGLTLIPPERRDPLLATTRGTGELIRHALDAGARRFILALGGSATNDGGAGMLQALGMKLLDGEGRPVGPGGGQLALIAAIDDAEWDPRIGQSSFLIASDVQNPLLGPEGATRVFGPQKGAEGETIEELERNMAAWADRIADKTGVRLHDKAGAGAAGGLCGAFLAFFPAAIRRGIDVVLEHAELRRQLQGASLVITGEGRIDGQTASGKAPMGIAQEAAKLGVPAFVLAGSVGPGIEPLYGCGIRSVHSIVNGPMTLEEAVGRAAELLEHAAEQLIRTIAYERGFQSGAPQA